MVLFPVDISYSSQCYFPLSYMVNVMLGGGTHEVHDPDKSNVEASVSFRYRDEFQEVGSMGANLEINGTLFFV